jgi:NitT/TauT family transport system permease protein
MTAAGTVRALVVAAFVLAIEALARSGIIDRTTMIPPSEMLAAMIDLARSGKLWKESAPTFRNVALAFVLAVLIGLAAGTVLHSLPRLRRSLDPLLASYYAVPFFALYPLFVVIFGLTDWPLIMIGIVFASVAVVVSTLNGIDRIPRVMIKVARTFRMGPLSQVALVIIPAIAPSLLTGIKLALAYAFIGILAGEFILASAGIGHAIAFAYDAFDNRTMYGLIAFTLILVTLMNMGLTACERWLLRGRTR